MATFYEGDALATAEHQLTEADFRKIRWVLNGYKTVFFTATAVILIVFAAQYCLIKAIPDYITFSVTTAVIAGLLIWWYIFNSSSTERAFASNQMLAQPVKTVVYRDSFECIGEHYRFKGFWSEASGMIEHRDFYILMGCRERELVLIRRDERNCDRLDSFFRENFGRKYHKAHWFSGMGRS